MPTADGFVMVPNSLVESKLSVWALAVWVALKYHADRNGGCFPSRETISQLSNMSPNQVTRALRELRQAGVIDAKLREGKTTLYEIPVSPIRSGHPHPIGEGSHPIGEGVSPNRLDTLFATGNDEQDPINNTQEQDGRRSKAKKDYQDERFNEFWKAYPRKEKKSESFRIWNKLHVNGEFGEIMSSLEKFKKSKQWTKDSGEYIPQPTAWLNGKRWEDEMPEPTDPWEEAIKRRDANARL